MAQARGALAAGTAVLLALALAPPAGARPPELALGPDGRLAPPADIALPETLGGLRRTVIARGSSLVAVYTGSGAAAPAGRWVSVEVMPTDTVVDLKRMRALSRAGLGPKKWEGADRTILEEGRFAWPGHPHARTFRGAYAAGGTRRDYWRAWDGGYAVTVTVETAREPAAAADALAAAAAARVFGAGS
ncbi:MAG: hypothetical protein JOZ90_02410 [Alphaproteobacteria bacterium]|nr:hypothetical protein [Alphaproteobacteria bacterium]MBV9371199.1 hypothetical protein [Alphaproteobacteria bacterium]MBV9899929.1 hypothetical protein [Alphaproteobacteria bacterium]